MSRDLYCANVRALGNAHSHITPESCTSDRTLPAQNTPECAGNVQRLSDDFKLVSTWWQWSIEDLAHFKKWARDNHADAAQWIHAEAKTVRHYQDHLHAASVTEFLRP
jgi:hypothetical protein